MSKRTNLAITIAALIVIGGCAPWPHKVTTVPEIQGVIESNDRPLQNAVVLLGRNLDWGKPCDEPTESVGRTDANGNFHIPPREESEFFYSFTPAFAYTPDGGQTTNVCFESDGTRIFGMELLYRRNVKQAFALTCNTNFRSISSSGVPNMICRAQVMSNTSADYSAIPPPK